MTTTRIEMLTNDIRDKIAEIVRIALADGYAQGRASAFSEAITTVYSCGLDELLCNESIVEQHVAAAIRQAGGAE